MRSLSGIQPSGQLHLGNYLGYVRPNIERHKTVDIGFIMIADLHALTTVQDPKKLQANINDMMLDLLCCGFDFSKTVIFRQSLIPEHAELMWILATVSPMGLLERAVSYKEKVERGIGGSVGLFAYPVLQTADIVLYDVNKVPIGKDQQQHVEIARDIAIKFNNTYGDVLVVPEGEVQKEVAVIPGIDGQKMSKSYGNTITLFGSESDIKKAIMGIKTDSKGATDPKDPDTCTVYQIHKLLLTKEEAKTLADEYRTGLSYGDAKKKLLTAYLDHFGPMRAKREELAKKPAEAEAMLMEGAKKASGIASKTMEKVRKAVGLR